VFFHRLLSRSFRARPFDQEWLRGRDDQGQLLARPGFGPRRFFSAVLKFHFRLFDSRICVNNCRVSSTCAETAAEVVLGVTLLFQVSANRLPRRLSAPSACT